MNQAPFSSPQAIGEWLRSALATPDDVLGISLFCGPHGAPNALCLMDVNRAAVAAVTQQVGGQPFGFTSVTVSLPLAPDFSCPARTTGMPELGRCSCHVEWKRS